MYEYPLGIPEGERPNARDLQQYAPADIVRRGLARYLLPRNPARTVRIHTYLGAPLTRALIMKTYGRLIPRTPFSNYRTDPYKSRIEAATTFALGGSVFNEAVHAAGMLMSSSAITSGINEGNLSASSVVSLVFNGALVSLQRYNRARMMLRVDEELAAGNGYRPDYRNWLAMDERAVEAYYDAMHPDDRAGEQSAAIVLRPAAPQQ
jgi:hypothetical protein